MRKLTITMEIRMQRAALLALFFCLLLVPSAFAQPAACGAAVETADVNGASLHYFECGEGEPLVFVHGSLGDLHSFDRQVEVFAEEFHVIAYSRRYHPPNDPPQAGEAYALQRHVADLAALVRELQVAPVHLVSHSYGAYVALALAVEHPDLVRSLVLGEPPVLSLLSRTSVGEGVREAWNRRVLDHSRSAFERGDLEEGLRRFLDGVLYAGWFDQLEPEVRTDMVETWGAEFGFEMLTERSTLLPPLACGALGQLERPTLLVTGERSPAMLLLVSTELERCLEGETHVMVPEASHGLQSENPTFFNETVLAFLNAPAMIRAPVQGGELEYEVRGDGEPVLLIHGGFIAASFLPVMDLDELRDYRLIRYHRRGYAGSTESEKPFSIEDQAADALALLRHLGIDRAHVVGHSYGGRIALQLALDAPGVVHSLVLLEPPLPNPTESESDEEENPSESESGEEVGWPPGELYRAGDHAGAVDWFMREIVAGPEWRREIARAVPGGPKQAVQDAATAFEVEFPTFNQWKFDQEQAEKISQPVVFVWGSETHSDFKEARDLAHVWWPQMKVHVVQGVHHALQMEDPRAVAEGIADFLRRHPLDERSNQ